MTIFNLGSICGSLLFGWADTSEADPKPAGRGGEPRAGSEPGFSTWGEGVFGAQSLKSRGVFTMAAFDGQF